MAVNKKMQRDDSGSTYALQLFEKNIDTSIVQVHVNWN